MMAAPAQQRDDEKCEFQNNYQLRQTPFKIVHISNHDCYSPTDEYLHESLRLTNNQYTLETLKDRSNIPDNIFQNCDVILLSTWSSINEKKLGDLVADAVDKGTNVVILLFSNTLSYQHPKGRFMAEHYNATTRVANQSKDGTLGKVRATDHPIMNKVKTITLGSEKRRSMGTIEKTEAEYVSRIADWNDGNPFIAIRRNKPGLIVEITCSFGINGAQNDAKQLINNSLRLQKENAPMNESLLRAINDSDSDIEEKCCACECHRKQEEIRFNTVKPTSLYRNAESECMNGKFADITFVVGKDKNKTEFAAMRGIFAMHCSYFANKLFSEERFVFGQKIIEEDINVTPIAFKYICQYFYQLNPVINADNVVDMLYAANKYGLEEIQINCDAFIDTVYKNQHIPNILSFETRAIHFSFKSTHSIRLRFHKFLTVETSQRILKCEAFLSAPKELIIQIIQNDSFSVKEEDIWIRCKDWCNHQIKINYECKEVTDSISWIALMKDTFVEHIRFSLMSKEFFVNQVYVSKVLSVEESIKITLYFMDPTTKISYNINPRHKVIYKYASELAAAQSKLKLYKTAQVLQYKLNISNKAKFVETKECNECVYACADNTYEALTNNNVNNGVATNAGAYAFIEANFDGKKQIMRMDIAGFGSAAGKGWNVGHLNNRMIQYKDDSDNWVDWKCIDGLKEGKISVMDVDIETNAMRVYYKAEGHICMGCWRFYGHSIESDRDV